MSRSSSLPVSSDHNMPAKRPEGERIAFSPPTQNEFMYAADSTLMSATDTRSYITYANTAFRHICGFGEMSMQGYPHNVIRHPDMPKEAFADMWSTIQSGDTWTGLVKNKRIDGDHYWVRANVAPIREENIIQGYISVRTQPQRQEIAFAEDLYAKVRSGKAQNQAFYKGLVINKGLFSFSRLRKSMPVRWVIRLALGIMMVFSLGLSWFFGQLPGLLIGALPVFLLSILVCFFLERRIAQPLETILEHAKDVAAGYTRHEFHMDRVDEIGMIARSINQSGLNLQALVDDVDAQMSGLQGVSEQIGVGNHELSQRTEQTSVSLAEAQRVTQEMNQLVQESASHANAAYELASSTYQAAERGGEIVGSVVQTMQEIARAATRISDINSVIDGIAFQTNLLALNASVEAARAGEVGRGFAVVASEVRNLALRSATAAKDIRSLIDDSVNKTLEGEKEAAQAGEAMNNILSEMRQVNDLVQGISDGARTQSASAKQVSTYIETIGAMTEKNAALVESISRAGDDMQSRMSNLNAVVQLFAHQKRKNTAPA